MQWEVRADISDGYRWRCPNANCRKTATIRSGSFFEKSRITLQKWLILLYWWARQYPVSDAEEEAGVSNRMAIDVYQWLREICSRQLLQMTITLGGTGKVVQIDESLFRHKPKVHKISQITELHHIYDTHLHNL